MKFSKLVLSLAVLPILVDARRAPKVKRNPANVVAIADFPVGNIIFSAKEGREVNVHVDVTGLPPSGGPFHYHIHENAVSEGNCESVGENFNPYSSTGSCDSLKNDAYCQVGDLSGKHGWIDTTCFETQYVDPFLSLNSLSKSYIVGRSISFHYANDVKFACADIQIASSETMRTLIDEYNYTDLVRIAGFDGADFDEEEALESESFEDASSKRADSDEEEDELQPQTYRPTNISNSTNTTGVAPQQYEEENAAGLKTIELSVLLASFIGLFV